LSVAATNDMQTEQETSTIKRRHYMW